MVTSGSTVRTQPRYFLSTDTQPLSKQVSFMKPTPLNGRESCYTGPVENILPKNLTDNFTSELA